MTAQWTFEFTLEALLILLFVLMIVTSLIVSEGTISKSPFERNLKPDPLVGFECLKNT